MGHLTPKMTDICSVLTYFTKYVHWHHQQSQQCLFLLYLQHQMKTVSRNTTKK